MKVRWTSVGVRLRITPTELAALRQGACLAESLDVGGAIVWSVELCSGGETRLVGEPGKLALTLSAGDIDRLAEPATEGVYFEAAGAAPLRYYVEKDFPCAHPGAPEANEPRSETFPAPDGFKRRHA